MYGFEVGLLDHIVPSNKEGMGYAVLEAAWAY